MKQFIGENKLFLEDVRKLSAGEKRRILNLRGLMSKKKILIFDEPTANLDDINGSLFWKEISESEKTVIVVSHDVPLKEKDIFDKIIIIDNHCKLIEIIA
jgi:ABC-type lipoprotein export system ATPase subunit